MKFLIKFSVLVISAVVFIACSTPVDESKIPGEYKWNRKDKIETLVLNPDGTYLHKFLTKEKELESTTGRWRFFFKQQEILCQDFVIYNEMGREFTITGNWFSAVSIASNNHVRLNYSRDENLYFEKTVIEKED